MKRLPGSKQMVNAGGRGFLYPLPTIEFCLPIQLTAPSHLHDPSPRPLTQHRGPITEQSLQGNFLLV